MGGGGTDFSSAVASMALAQPVAGLSAPALRRAHLQRLLAFGLGLAMCTFVGWESIMSSWTTRAGPGRIFRDSLALMVSILSLL